MFRQGARRLGRRNLRNSLDHPFFLSDDMSANCGTSGMSDVVHTSFRVVLVREIMSGLFKTLVLLTGMFRLGYTVLGIFSGSLIFYFIQDKLL